MRDFIRLTDLRRCERKIQRFSEREKCGFVLSGVEYQDAGNF